MQPYYESPQATIYNKSCLDMSEVPDESIQCCVTSPPYWGLRDYGSEPMVWGGDSGCVHEWKFAAPRRQRSASDIVDKGSKQATQSASSYDATGSQFCLHCNAWHGSLGLELTPELFVQHLVEIFREVRRVLRKDGTCWLNLGDSYASTGRTDRKESPGVGARQSMEKPGRDVVWKAGGGSNFSWTLPGGQKPKDLVGIPWMVAFALQADGWYLRSDIIWAKPNPMPESVTDRPIKSHEYIFLLSKNQKYFYNAEAIREPAQDWGTRDRTNGKYHNKGTGLQPHSGFSDSNNAEHGRNKRSVWTIATQSFHGAHFAVFPEALVEPCVMAGSKPGDTILDPFGGACTTALVAQRLGCKAIIYELKQEYCDIGIKRLPQLSMELHTALSSVVDKRENIMAWNPSPQVAAARDFGKKFGKNKVIIIGIDEKAGTFETISYGQTKAECYVAEKSADDIVALIENGTIRV